MPYQSVGDLYPGPWGIGYFGIGAGSSEYQEVLKFIQTNMSQNMVRNAQEIQNNSKDMNSGSILLKINGHTDISLLWQNTNNNKNMIVYTSKSDENSINNGIAYELTFKEWWVVHKMIQNINR